MDIYQIYYSESFIEDILRLELFLKLCKVDKAKIVETIDKIKKSIDTLETFPSRFPILEGKQFGKFPIRKMIIGFYIVKYQVNEDKRTVTILKIFNCRENPDKIKELHYGENN